MRSWDRLSLAAVLTALCLTVTAAFYPAPRGAWWCTAFSVTCREAADSTPSDKPEIEVKWKLAEWWGRLTAES